MAKKKAKAAPPALHIDGRAYSELSKHELYHAARELGIEGRARMARGELIRVLSNR